MVKNREIQTAKIYSYTYSTEERFIDIYVERA